MTHSTAHIICRSAARSLPPRSIFSRCFCLLLATSLGCQNGQWGNRPAVVPPPGGMLNRPDAYYSPPAITPGTPLGAQSAQPRNSISLSPGTNSTAQVPATGVRSPSQNTYDVASRVPADSQPIRVLDSTRSTASANTPRGGMPINDGTNASGWRNGLPPATVSSNPFSGLRGTQGTSQGFSGSDGQWRSRSSYEATERR